MKGIFPIRHKSMLTMLVAIALSTTSILYAQTDDRSKHNIKGPVAIVYETKYGISYGTEGYTRGNCISSTAKHFDSNGNIKTSSDKDLTYDYNDSCCTTIPLYQTTGRITIDESKHRFTIERANAKFICTYKHSIHRPTSAKYYPCRGCHRQEGRTAILKYDKHGNILSVSNYISQIEINGDYISSTYESDYNPKAKYGLKFEYEYDTYGNWTIMKCYNSSGIIIDWKEREYKYEQDSQ